MRRPVLNFCLVLFSLPVFGGFVFAQDATPPPPPADAPGTSLQEPAAGTNIRAVRLSEVQGSVQVLQNGQVAFNQAQINMPLVEGMKIVAAESGRAEIQFEDGSVARITPNSAITLSQLSRSDDGTTTVIDADAGLTYYELNGRSGQYAVQSGGDKIVPLDSSIFRIDLDNPPAELAVMHGSVHVDDNENLVVDVHTNQTMRFDALNPDEYQLLQSVAADSWDQWNSDRDEALAELDENVTTARASTGNPDDAAWNDLDASGDWYDVPGYGMGWSPSGVGQDWDPYGEGSWGYYDNVGYTWISGYSWGWWPYHCGAWNWFDGSGWMWFPGNCGMGEIGADWYPYGVIWGAPPGYRRPRRPLPHPHPVHGPIEREPLIAVNRGPQFTQQFRSVGVAGGAAGPRVFQYEGQNIAPMHASIHPLQGGPLGEGFTSAMQRTNPETVIRPAYGVGGYTSYGGLAHPGYGYVAPGAGYTPSRGYTAPSRPAPSAGEHYSAPAPAFHAPAAAAPAAGGHGHR